ncbi:MAG: hypothetical protein JG764_1292 [Clostridiales bacterium]|jgi:glycosyltransferase involved in cell wall biosynthesis|nr:hypothetical protein [Clostridiales bacterium]
MKEGTITLAMIVKNEEENLQACLDSVSHQVDEIVIVDTGSTDSTLEIARKFTNKIYRYPWDDDFSAARNFAIEKASSEWILSLDADEELAAETGDLKGLITRDKSTEAYLLPLDNPTADGNGEYNRFLVLRLFKNNGQYRFEGKIHEQIVITKKEALRMAAGPVIKHKMLPSGERNRKRGRNLSLLKKAYSREPQNHFLEYYLGVEWLMLGKPGKALPYLEKAYRNITDSNLFFRAPALRYLIISLQSLGRLDEAICLCLEAELKYPDYTDIYYLCGILFEEKKELQLAIKWFNQAVKCGTPPPFYSHMNGTESFLAFYHLGYCHEMLGQTNAAQNYYEQALAANPKYTFPIYNLFLLLKAKSGARHTLKYLKEKGYLGSSQLALPVANLFFASGFPGLARLSLEEVADKKNCDEMRFCLGQYNIFSGKLEQGLKHLKQVSVESKFYIQSQILQTIALLLLERFAEGRSLALKLWRNQETRCEGWILVNLTRMMEKDGIINCPQKIREKELLTPALEIFNLCNYYLPEYGRQNPRLLQLAANLKSIIKSTSPQGYLTLLEFYRDKAGRVRSSLNYKFKIGGNTHG